MSKSKEEILQHHYIHGKGLTHPEYVQNAMDEYASQVLSEYKEKLKAEIRRIVASEGMGKYTINKALEIVEQL